MESALRLSYGSPLCMPQRVPSPVTTARATKVQFSYKHSSLSLSTGSTSRPIGHPFVPVINAFDRSSVLSVNKDAHKMVRGTVGVSLDLACGLGVNGSSSRMNRKGIAKASMPTSGKTALQSLFDVIKCLASRTTEPSDVPKHVNMDIVRTMKSGKVDEALAELTRQVAEEKELKGQHPANDKEMELVAFLICQGKFNDASLCDCIKTEYKLPPSFSQICPDEGEHKECDTESKEADDLTDLPSDSRLRLYKAIIHTMLNEKCEAAKWWCSYIDAVQHGFDDPTKS